VSDTIYIGVANNGPLNISKKSLYTSTGMPSRPVILPLHEFFCTDVNFTLLLGKISIQFTLVSGDGGD
jgi:hypothetical protein